MKSVSITNIIIGIVVYILLGFIAFFFLNVLPPFLSLSDSALTEAAFKSRYVLLGLVAFGISFVGWLLWESLARKLFVNNIFGARFHMSRIWWFYTLILLLVTFLLTMPIYKLISFSGNLGASVISVTLYPACAILDRGAEL